MPETALTHEFNVVKVVSAPPLSKGQKAGQRAFSKMGPKPKILSSACKLPSVNGKVSSKEKTKTGSVTSSKQVTSLPAVSGRDNVDKDDKVIGEIISNEQLEHKIEISKADIVTEALSDELFVTQALSDELLEQLSMLISFTVASEVVQEQLKNSYGEDTSIIEDSLKIEREAKFARENGKVILVYEMYNEEFDIYDGKVAKEYIDEEYCLSDIMPNCAIHLSALPEKKLIYEALEEGRSVFLPSSGGYILGLEVGNSYTVFVEQSEEALKRDQAEMALRAQSMDGAVDPNAPEPLQKDDGRVGESCSCIYGNPCTDEYGCKDWYNRYAISMKNGWKGF